MTQTDFIPQVLVTSSSVQITLHDQRVDAIQTFEALTNIQREQLAHDAWHVGLRALMNAYRRAEEVKLQDIGKTLANDLDEQLRDHSEAQEKALTSALGRYFDPQSGELGLRLRQFVGDDGTLPQLLQRHLGPRNSVLVETLTKHLGEQSPLFRLLSPTDSQGLVSVIGERLRQVLQQEHSAFQKALDPLQTEGAVGRFIARLREELKRAEDDQAKQLKVALAALDTTKDDSLLNQLRRDTQQAREALLTAINPATEGSPLAVIKSSLTELLAVHAKSQQESLAKAHQESVQFQQDVRDAVRRIEERRRDDQRGQRGGGVFEDLVAEFVQRQIGAYGYVVETTGNVVGLRPNCKVGDVVVCYPPEHAFVGWKLVIEAKRDRSYTVSKALDEIATARSNRDAVAGIFVMARSHAGPGFQTFARYGKDIVVVWDDENPTSDPYMQAALMVGLALAFRAKKNAGEGDLQALQGIEQRLVKELERMEKIRKSAETIRKQAESIDKEATNGHDKIGKLLDDAKRTLTSLNVDLLDDAMERRTPICLDAPSCALEASQPDLMLTGGAHA